MLLLFNQLHPQNIVKKFTFCFLQKKVKQASNDIRVSKWQNFHFWVYCFFNIALYNVSIKIPLFKKINVVEGHCVVRTLNRVMQCHAKPMFFTSMFQTVISVYDWKMDCDYSLFAVFFFFFFLFVHGLVGTVEHVWLCEWKTIKYTQRI